MPHLLIFGFGYTARHLARAVRARGWSVSATRRAPDHECVAFDDQAALLPLIEAATHILSSVPPNEQGDPVLARYGSALVSAGAEWVGYLSSTGVYGDTAGAWVDESAAVGRGRRSARASADLLWQGVHDRARVFRLPGIYGPGRSPLDRVAEGRAARIDVPGQVFSRIHVDDIVGGVLASVDGPAGVYNLADDVPASQNVVIEEACRLLGRAPPPLQTLDEAALSPAARAFYSENRRVANGKARRLLGWRPLYPSYREGLRALSASTRPASANAAPAAASSDQR